MAYRLRYSMQFNAREAMHMLELRSSPQGHPSYRRVALEMHRLIAERAGHHAIAATMSHMTTNAPLLERLESERRAAARRGEPDSPGVTPVTGVAPGRSGHPRLCSARNPPYT
jgi:thymidylate synthase ThyX